MAIRRMISRDPGEFREFQRRMTTVGKIRLGVYETPPGQRGRPKKIDTFRFTSENEQLIRAVADAYGGEAREWTPQGSKTAEWEVISATSAVPVYVVNGQDLDPWYEAWAGGRTCVRRCDGIVNKITQELCVCIPADGSPSGLAPKDQCKPTTRAQVMLAEIQGLGSWMLESHGENAARELATYREFIASAPMPVPAMLRLRHETRRQWNFDKKKFDSLDFYVPWFDISAINAAQIGIGGDALTQALAAAGAPSAIGGTQMAIEARPVSAPAAREPMIQPAPLDIERLRPRILADIKACATVDDLEAIKAKLISRGISDQRVKEAWLSKMAAVRAAVQFDADLGGEPPFTDPADDVPAASHPEGSTRYAVALAGGREFFADCLPQYDEAVQRGATHRAIVDAGGPLHWLACDDQSRAAEAAERNAHREEYRVGDTVTVGGIEFTKISDNPFPPGGQAEAMPVEGTVETTGPILPDVPDDDYDADELYTSLMTGASKQTPPLTTAEVNSLISGTFGVHHTHATGRDLARLRAALKTGVVTWR